MSYQRVRVDPASLVIDPNLIPLYSRPVRIAMPSFTWVRDKRDNPVDTHKGSYNLLDLGLATSALGSESNFGKILFQNSTYYTFKKRWVFARNTQIGIEHPYGTNYYPGRIGDGDSAAGAVLRRRRQFVARLRHQPGGTARPADRLSHRRAGAVRQQPGDSYASGAAALRR